MTNDERPMTFVHFFQAGVSSINCFSQRMKGVPLVLRGSFFFQAEDGIRDYKVTGVQTCGLPIFTRGAEDPAELIGEHFHLCEGIPPRCFGASVPYDRLCHIHAPFERLPLSMRGGAG